MLKDRQKIDIETRMNRITGQIAGIQRMVNEDRYCVDILTQTSAVVAALRTVEDIIMENHLNTCVADAIRSNNPDEQKEKIAEVMTVITRLRKRA